MAWQVACWNGATVRSSEEAYLVKLIASHIPLENGVLGEGECEVGNSTVAEKRAQFVDECLNRGEWPCDGRKPH